MDDNRSVEKRRCPAMVEAGVYDPESKEGIDFCVNYCPYENCVIFENALVSKSQKRKRIAQGLRKHGVSVDDIVLILGVSRYSVMRYLRK